MAETDWVPVGLPLVPCSDCGSTAASAHVYGLRKCCPDCSHDLADHDRQVAARALREAGLLATRPAPTVDAAEAVDLDPAITGGYSEHHNAEDAAETWLRARADRIEREGGA